MHLAAELLTDWLIMDDETQIHYDNSKAFAAYLKSQGVDALLPRLKLKLKQTHTIVPQVSDIYAWMSYLRPSKPC